MSPPQQRERLITGVIAIRRARLPVVRPLKAESAGDWPQRSGSGSQADDSMPAAPVT
jgi:hypothetical protein